MLLSAKMLNQMIRQAIGAGLAAQQDALFSGLPDPLRDSLPTDSRPSAQLIQRLSALNQQPDIDGFRPLAAVLAAASLLTEAQEVSDTFTDLQQRVEAASFREQGGMSIPQASADSRWAESARARRWALFTEATTVVATIATGQGAVRAAAETRFWELYWGPLAMVEGASVEGAMVRFGQALEDGRSQEHLQRLSLQLAHAAREEVGEFSRG